MFMKVYADPEHSQLTMIDGIMSFHREAMDRKEAVRHYDDTLLHKGEPQPQVWKLYLRFQGGRELYLLADLHSVFIENDQGKTIERF